MSGIEGGDSSEVDSSSEVEETSTDETGGEASEETQEAAAEEANESGGFDEDIEMETDTENDIVESSEENVEDAENTENIEEYEIDEDSTSGDEDRVGFDYYNNEESSEYNTESETEESEDGDITDEQEESDDANAETGFNSEEDTTEDIEESNETESDGEAESDGEVEEDTAENESEDEEVTEESDEAEETESENEENESYADEETNLDAEGDDQGEEETGELEEYSDESEEDSNEAESEDDANDEDEVDSEQDTENTEEGNKAESDSEVEEDTAESESEGEETESESAESESEDEEVTEESDEAEETESENEENESDADEETNLDAEGDDQGEEETGELEEYSDEVEDENNETESEDDANDEGEVDSEEDTAESESEDEEVTEESDDVEGTESESEETESESAESESEDEEATKESDDTEETESENEENESEEDSSEAESEDDVNDEGEVDSEEDTAESESEGEEVTEESDDVEDTESESEETESESAESESEDEEATEESDEAEETESESEAEEDSDEVESENEDEEDSDEEESENEDTGELEQYSDENVEDNNESDKVADNIETEQGQEAKEQVTEEDNKDSSENNTDKEQTDSVVDSKDSNSNDIREQNEEQPNDANAKTEETTDKTMSSIENDKEVSATELSDNRVMVNASDIDMTYARGMDSDQFWNHHGNTKEDYMQIAEKIPDVQQALDDGKSLDEIKQDPELKDAALAYFDSENMIKVEQQPDGSYSFVDDGRHRIAAAQELGYDIPVEVTNMPKDENVSNIENTDLQQEETKVPEDIISKSDISNETCENLSAFEQNSWDNLSQVEKEQAIEELRDSIAEDLQIENKPDIAYYNNEDSGDYGGYAASTNTIYINQFNMGNAAETADTIAHESRHCWQHERADNPQTEQDQRFKENFDNYIKPEINFEAYQSQPVEQDASDYAEQVKDLISQTNTREESVSEPFNGSENEYKAESSHAPQNEGYESKIVTELPTDFESKNDLKIGTGIDKIKDAVTFGAHMKQIYQDKNLTPYEKYEYGLKVYNALPGGKRANINVVENFKSIRTDKESLNKGIEYGYLPIAFDDHHGLDKSKPINGIETEQPLPEVLCRRGSETGNNLTEPHKDGSVPTNDELSIPYAANEEAIHFYKTDAEGYKEAIDIISSQNNIFEKSQDINILIDKMNHKHELQNDTLEVQILSDYIKSYNKFQNSNDTWQCRQDGKCDSKYGVCGTVAPMYVDNDLNKEKLYNGGAPQYNTPCSIAIFLALGVFREYKKK